GSFLSVTWVQNFRTSPVKRGVWVLENILGTPPPEPPPNVPPLEDSAGGSGKILTLREQMTIHRKNEPCASCHKLMDPIGFALENFDADAKWRTKQGGDGGTPIDTSVELYDGEKVNGPVELRQGLLRYSPQFVRMFTEKMMTYALGRGVEYYDIPVIRIVGIWHPHGAAPGYWSPLQEGSNFEFSFITKPLEPFRDRVVLITGLDMPEAMATEEEPGGDHARGAALLSGARPRRNAV